jgi:hypothetical protein
MAIAITLSNGRIWKTKAAALTHYKAMLARYADGAVVEDRCDHDDLVALLERYDEAITDGPSKTGVGIDHFTRTRNNFNGYSTPSFWVHRTDGTATDFSYISGVNGQPKGLSREFYDACRAAVQDDLITAKRRFFDEHSDEQGSVPCEITGARIDFENAHLDHAWPTFGQIVAAFRAARTWTREIPVGIVTLPADAQTQSVFQDLVVADAFKAFHHDLAVLRIVQRKINLAMATGQRRPTVQRPLRLSTL